MEFNNFEIECPECGTKFKVDCDTCGHSIDDGFCKWNIEHGTGTSDNDPCTFDKYRWKPKKKDVIIPKSLKIALEANIAERISIEEAIKYYKKNKNSKPKI